jgi:NAD(P)-dependent dehydrogenase (short-subunit alcohol dehydrogenase family)
VMASPEKRTKQGLEATIGVNHFGHFLLFVELLPALERAGKARVVVLSSGGHWWGAFDFDDWNWERRELDTIRAYAESKTANTLFVVEADRLYRARGVRFYAVAPGFVNTAMGRHLTDEDNRKLGMTPEVRAMGKSPQEGAASVAWAATGPEFEGQGGLYLQDGQVVPAGTLEVPNRGVAPFATDAQLARRLWALSESVVRENGSC